MARTHVITERIVDPDTGAVSFQTTTVPFTAEEEAAADAAALQAIFAAADAKLVALQQAGVTVNGVLVSTTERGMTLLNGAVSRAKEDPSKVCNWVIGPGVKVDLDAATVTAIGLAVGDWINAGYAALYAIYDKISNGTYTTDEQVTGASEWPSSTITTP